MDGPRVVRAADRRPQTLIGLPEPSAPIAASVILALVTLAAAVGPLVGATRVLSRDDILSA